jgi:hypothetical protein
MKHIPFTLLMMLSLMVLAACGGGFVVPTPAEPAAAPVEPAATLDVQATVEAAVAATATAEAQLQEMVDEAVAEAVDEALETVEAAPPPAETETMSEEELAALIEQTVTDAVTATESYAAATTQATADTAVTSEELQTIEVYVSGAEEAIALAEELLGLYEDLYADLTYAALDDLDALVAELDQLNQNLETMTAVLIDINNNLESGLALAEDTITQLETAAVTAAANAAAAQAQAQAWQQTVQNEVASRAALLASVQPQTIAATQQEAVAQVAAYLTTVQTALADQQFTSAEFSAIVQANADVVASLQAQGGPQLQSLAAGINMATAQLAAGNFNQAALNLNDLTGLLATIPDISNLPSLTMLD